jgi:hypothetical protein
MILRSNLHSSLLMKPKKRQFYNHDLTLRHADPLYKHERLFSLRVSLPLRVGILKTKLQTRRKKLKDLVIMDCNKMNTSEFHETARNSALKNRRKLKPIFKSIDAAISTPETRALVQTPYPEHFMIDAITST